MPSIPTRLSIAFAFFVGLSCPIFLAIDSSLLRGADATIKRQIPITVAVEVEGREMAEGQPIPLIVTITNGLPEPIDFNGFGTEANDWNAETFSIRLVDIYRDGQPGGLFEAAPSVEPPVTINGMSRRVIPPGKSLTIKTDARKWTICGGWKKGSYRINMKVSNLRVDDYCTLAVMSDPHEFRIK